MSTQPRRRRLEPGIYERVGADGERLGLEIAFKDAAGKARRRTVKGNVEAARDALATARTRRVKREPEPADPRRSLNAVADAFEAAHVAGLSANSRAVYRTALRRLRKTFGTKRMGAITKAGYARSSPRRRRKGSRRGRSGPTWPRCRRSTALPATISTCPSPCPG